MSYAGAGAPSRFATRWNGGVQPYLTEHARARIAEMGVQEERVLAAVREPVDVARSHRNPTARIAYRGPLGVVFDPRDGAVITVLWSGNWRDL